MEYLKVYGAPRDPVNLSLRLNGLQEAASCTGVGKAGQTALLDLNTGDTVTVWVNEKTRLVDTETNRFTHFIGILLRPDSIN